ncbi:MAG TPA: hypothetical protein VHB77_11060 [Planctomycetaceae bacterium]|nr:hypothetical protein [Planctomycetaceae bacterium]
MNVSRRLLGIVLLGIFAPGCTCYCPSPRMECWQMKWENRMACMNDWLMEQNCRYRTRNCQQSAALMAALRNPCVGGMYTDGPMYAAGQACCSRCRGRCGNQCGVGCGNACGGNACGGSCGDLLGCNSGCGSSGWGSWLSGWGSSGGCGSGGCGMGGCGCNGNAGWMTGASAGAPMLSQGAIMPGPMQNLAQMQTVPQMQTVAAMPAYGPMPMSAPVQTVAALPAYPQVQTFAPAQPVPQMQVIPQPQAQTGWGPIALRNPLPAFYPQQPQSIPLSSTPMMGAGAGMPMVVTPQASVPVNTVNYGPVLQTAALPVVQAH